MIVAWERSSVEEEILNADRVEKRNDDGRNEVGESNYRVEIWARLIFVSVTENDVEEEVKETVCDQVLDLKMPRGSNLTESSGETCGRSCRRRRRSGEEDFA